MVLFINDLLSNLIVKLLVAKPMIEKLSGYPKVSAYADFYATRKGSIQSLGFKMGVLRLRKGFQVVQRQHPQEFFL